MWNRFFYALLFFLSASHTYANTFLNQAWVTEIDSLKAVAASLPNDTSKVNVYLDLAYRHIFNDSETAIHYADSAFQLSVSLKFVQGEAKAQNRMALAYSLQNNNGKALELINDALKTHKKINDLYWQANDFNVLGLIYRNEQKFEEGIKSFRTLLNILPELESASLRGFGLSNLGMCQFDLGRTDSALYYYEQSLQVFQSNNFTRESAFVLDNLADLFTHNKDYKKALEYLNQAIEINRVEGNQLELGRNYIKLARIYTITEDYAKAQFFLKEAADLAIEYKLGTILKETYTNYKLLFLKQEQYNDAYIYAEKERMLSDSLLTVAQSEQIANLKKVYEFEKLHQNLIISDQKVKTQQRMLYMFIVGAFLLLALIYLLLKFFRNKMKSNEVLEQMNSEMRQQSAKLKQANDQISKMNDNLEKLIQERTEELQKQNEKLIEYAYFNAHEIRGPMARLAGLLNLSKNYPEGINDKDFLNKVYEAIVELQQKVDEISRVFREEDSE